jgi:hypothetical protein
VRSFIITISATMPSITTQLTETPFKIAIPEPQLSRLRQKLALTILPDELPESDWAYGVPLSDIQRLVKRWGDGYDWRKHEAELNDELPQFMRGIEVDGFGVLGVHYVHKRSILDSAVPLLFVHGCEFAIPIFISSANEQEYCSTL